MVIFLKSIRNGHTLSHSLPVHVIDIWDASLVITVTADVLAPTGAMPSAGTVLTSK